MLVAVQSVSREGALCRVVDDKNKDEVVWLPGGEWGLSPEDWARVWRQLDSQYEVDVIECSGVRQRDGYRVVSKKSFNAEHVDETWLHQPRTMRVTDLSALWIQGTIGNVPAAILRKVYHDSVERRRMDHYLPDHSALAPGDYITGIVTDLRHPQNIWVVLDPDQYLDLRASELMEEIREVRKAGSEMPDLDQEEDTGSLTPYDQAVTMICKHASELSPLVLVENDDHLRKSLSELLTKCNVKVSAFSNNDEAHDVIFPGTKPYLADTSYKLAIIDPNLKDDGNDHTGLELAAELRGRSSCKILILTAEKGALPSKMQKWGELHVDGYCEKDVPTEQFLLCILEAVRLRQARPLRSWVSLPPDGVIVAEHSPPTEREMTPEEALKELRGGDTSLVAHVFEIHPRSQRARSRYSIGAGLDWETFAGKIGKSRIKDAASSATPIFEEVAAEGDGQHFWTRQMMSYRSFAGVRIRTIADDLQRALVTFHPKEGAFADPMTRTRFLLCAERIGRMIDRDALLKRSKDSQELETTGRALECASHEMSGQLLTLDADMKALGNISDIAALRLGHKQAIELIRDMRNTAAAMRGVNAAAKEVCALWCLRRAATSCARILPEMFGANSQYIHIATPEENERFPVRVPTAALVIVLFNLYLNAAQQIELAGRVRRCGKIWHSIERSLDSRDRPIVVIRIFDTGPGVHNCDWETIFKPGHSTKPGGTGLGLHICRNLLARVGDTNRRATVQLTRSVVWDGSTFSVTLPLVS